MRREFLIYVNYIYFGCICDDRFFVKKTKSNANYNPPKHTPYPNAKEMFLVLNVDDKNYLQQLVINTIIG